MQPFQVSQYTGSATYSLDLWTPPGLGGLQPSLTLSYNSQEADSATGLQAQASWVGMGWSLDTGSIERSQNGTTGYTDDDTFSISAAGVSSMLLAKTTSEYHTADETFWRVVYNQPSDTWTAWDKSGTKYVFGEDRASRAMYPYGKVCDMNNQPVSNLRTYKWGLSRITNIYGQSLTFSYFRHAQPSSSVLPCSGNPDYTNVDNWLYPEKIVYPNGKYQVLFTLNKDDPNAAARRDYKTNWTDPDGYSAYMRYYLTGVSIQHKPDTIWQTVRRYQFAYHDQTVSGIFPGADWRPDSGHGYNLTLASVTEHGTGGAALPATTFTYDDLHLVSAANGYGGKIDYTYDLSPWHEITATHRTKHQVTATEDVQWPNAGVKTFEVDGCYDRGGWAGPALFEMYWGGEFTTEALGCDGDKGTLKGAAYLPGPKGYFQPGAMYRFTVTAKDNASGSNTPTVKLYLSNGVNPVPTSIAEVTLVNNGTSFTPVSGYVLLPGDSASLTPIVICTHQCKIEKIKLELLTTHYRVTGRTLDDGLSETPAAVYTYRYDEPATNDTTHSAWASTEHPYSNPLGEFRGHGMVQEVGPSGQVSWTFFHQDDLKKGRPAVNIIGTEEYQTSFNDCAGWTGCVTAPFRGDPAMQITTAGSFVTAERSGSAALTDGDSVLTQFMVSGASSEAVLAVQTVTGSYHRWGIYALPDASLTLRYYVNGAAVDVPLYSAGTFLRDTWYVLLLTVDDNDGFLLRMWERNNPSSSRRTELVMPAGQSWRFFAKGKNGTLRLDAYSEGRIQTIGETFYTAASTPPATAVVGKHTITEYGGPPNFEPYEVDYPFNYDGLAITWVYANLERTFTYEGDASWVVKRTSYGYEGTYGNLLTRTEAWFDATAGVFKDYRLEVTDYIPFTSTDKYLVGLPARVSTYDCDGFTNGACTTGFSNSRLNGQVHYLYDNHSVYNQAPSDGKPTGQRSLLRFDGANFTNPRYQDSYFPTASQDAWGNVLDSLVYPGEGSDTSFGVGTPRHTYAVYDPNYHTYPLRQTNDLGHPVDFTYNFDLGLPVTMTGPNGAAVSVEYDGLGRLTQVIRPGDTASSPTLSADYDDQIAYPSDVADPNLRFLGITVTQRIDAGHIARWLNLYDGFGNLIQKQTANATLASGQADILVNYHYNSTGSLIAQSVPFSTTVWTGAGLPLRLYNSSQFSTTTVYDALGRVDYSIAPDGARTDYGYLDLTTVVTDTLGHKTTTQSDLWGRTVQVDPEPLANAPGVNYTYDTQDHLKTATRGGATVSMGYDLAGRKLSMSDPDMGNWSYAYDALGNLTRQTDARGQRICMYYDTLSRLTGKYYHSDDNCPASLPANYAARFTYDQGTFGIGQRTLMEDKTGQTTWSYDSRGQVITQTQVITGNLGTYITAWGYNSAGLVSSMTYPDGEIVTTDYYNQLTLDSVLGPFPDNYSYTTSYDAAGRVVNREVWLEGALQSQYQYYDWDTKGGRLSNLYTTHSIANPPGEVILQDLTYDYDLVGNVKTITDSASFPGVTQVQSFNYDAIYRLIHAQATGGTSGTYSEDYTYNSTTGNLATKAGKTYTYGDPLHAHAVTRLNDGSQFAYTYDSNGNMLTRRVYEGQVKTYNLAYDVENQLVGVTGDATVGFKYNGDGARVITTEGATTTIYIGNYYEVRNTGGTTETTKYYYAGAARIAMRKNDAANPTFLLGDHLGSTSMAYDGTTTPVRHGYTAWGEFRFSVGGELPTNYQYTGQFNQKSIGLYYYGARWYDPVTIQFQSPDTLVPNPYQPLDLNRYSYARYNPLRYSDPSGHKPCTTVDSPDRCTTYPGEKSYTVNELARYYGVTFKSGVREENCSVKRRSGEEKCHSRKVIRWTEAQMWAVIMGIAQAVSAVNRVKAEAGKIFYGLTVTLTDTSARPDCLAGADGFSCSGAPSARLVVHELGHVFNTRLGDAAYTRMGAASIWTVSGSWVTGRANDNGTGAWLRTRDGYVSIEYPDVMHWTDPGDSVAQGEEFADMFMNWVFNSFAADQFGQARMTWMTQAMSKLLR